MFKSGKIDIFQKGLTDGFGPKMGMCSTFFCRKYRPEKCFYDILERQHAFLGYKNKEFK